MNIYWFKVSGRKKKMKVGRCYGWRGRRCCSGVDVRVEDRWRGGLESSANGVSDGWKNLEQGSERWCGMTPASLERRNWVVASGRFRQRERERVREERHWLGAVARGVGWVNLGEEEEEASDRLSFMRDPSDEIREEIRKQGDEGQRDGFRRAWI